MGATEMRVECEHEEIEVSLDSGACINPCLQKTAHSYKHELLRIRHLLRATSQDKRFASQNLLCTVDVLSLEARNDAGHLFRFVVDAMHGQAQ